MSLKILYIGSLNPDSNSFRRYKTLMQMGHRVEAINIDTDIYGSLFEKFHHHLNLGPGVNSHNKKVIGAAKALQPDLFFIDNKPYLKPTTIRQLKKMLPAARLINVITDDVTGKLKYAWRLCLKTADLYDCHFVQRSINIAELKKYGANRVEMCYRSFDPLFNRPLQLNEHDQDQYHVAVGFAGTYEEDRASFIAFLIQHKIPVAVTGNDWPQGKYWDIIRPYYKGPSIYGDAYIKTINGMDIALHFLRHGNRDEQDSRTFEIPACSVFMLAERSNVHMNLFLENEEAVFFDSKEELLEKLTHYLERKTERDRIATNGYNKCFTAGYTHEARMKDVIEKTFADTKL